MYDTSNDNTKDLRQHLNNFIGMVTAKILVYY